MFAYFTHVANALEHVFKGCVPAAIPHIFNIVSVPLLSGEVYTHPCIFMDIHGFPINSYDNPLTSMDLHRHLWIDVAFKCSFDILGLRGPQWVSMEIYGCP